MSADKPLWREVLDEHQQAFEQAFGCGRNTDAEMHARIAQAIRDARRDAAATALRTANKMYRNCGELAEPYVEALVGEIERGEVEL